jgi:hypothetical protein
MKKMKSGNTCVYRIENVPIMSWKEKRVVITMSTHHNTPMEKMATIQKGGKQREIQKLMCVLDYTKHTGGVHHSDHYFTTHAFIRKSLNWRRKLFFWCLKVYIVNSYILYCSQKAVTNVTC